jgi:hypothetical protein
MNWGKKGTRGFGNREQGTRNKGTREFGNKEQGELGTWE